ncbi:MAG: MarC family protein [Victivallaceae bacterium]|nr:MarC family protein [Victivallaceae bacterium]
MFSSAIQLFILLGPFFVLSVFVAKTDRYQLAAKRKVAVRASITILLIAFIVYYLGNFILRGLGITLDAFRIGAGLVLLLSGLEMVRGSGAGIRSDSAGDGDEDENVIAIVPIAIPCAIGPGTIGALLMMGDGAFNDWRRMLCDIGGILFAVAAIWLVLYFANQIERLIGKRGISILSKLTGLFLAALASQIIMLGVKNLITR